MKNGYYVIILIIFLGLSFLALIFKLGCFIEDNIKPKSTPITFKVTDNYGLRKDHPILHKQAKHNGIDISATIGTPIKVQSEGVVTFIGQKRGYGNYIVVKNIDNISIAYAHLASFGVGLKLNSIVKPNDIIGFVGVTGRTTGPHLHLEVLKDGLYVDPMLYKDKWLGGMLILEKDKYAETELHSACEEGDINKVKLLLERISDKDINAINYYGETALHITCEKGNTEIFKLLLERMSDIGINISDNYGETALDIAIEKGYEDIVELILKRIKVNEKKV